MNDQIEPPQPKNLQLNQRVCCEAKATQQGGFLLCAYPVPNLCPDCACRISALRRSELWAVCPGRRIASGRRLRFALGCCLTTRRGRAPAWPWLCRATCTPPRCAASARSRWKRSSARWADLCGVTQAAFASADEGQPRRCITRHVSAASLPTGSGRRMPRPVSAVRRAA